MHAMYEPMRGAWCPPFYAWFPRDLQRDGFRMRGYASRLAFLGLSDCFLAISLTSIRTLMALLVGCRKPLHCLSAAVGCSFPVLVACFCFVADCQFWNGCTEWPPKSCCSPPSSQNTPVFSQPEHNLLHTCSQRGVPAAFYGGVKAGRGCSPRHQINGYKFFVCCTTASSLFSF